jgi:hypothetical protein
MSDKATVARMYDVQRRGARFMLVGQSNDWADFGQVPVATFRVVATYLLRAASSVSRSCDTSSGAM